MTADTLAERDTVLAEVELAHQEAINAGLDILRSWAVSGQPFSANDTRDQLHAVGIGSKSAGALFNAAITAGIIRRVGWETSTDLRTKHKPVNQYVGVQP